MASIEEGADGRVERRGSAQPAEPPPLAQTLAGWRSELGVGAALLVLIVVCSFLGPNFLTLSNFEAILRQTSVTMIVAVGMTMVIIAGEIDLSVGSMVALAGVVFAWLIVHADVTPVLAALATFALAAAIGAFTGLLRVRWRIASFITTLGLLSVLRGVAVYITDGVSIGPLPEGLGWFWYGAVLGIKVPIAIMLAVVLAGAFVLSHTVFGRHLYATGGRAASAARYGVNVSLIRVAVFVIVSMLSALGGMLLAIRLDAADAGNGTLLELDVIAAVIVGGTLFTGGAGRMIGTVLGVMFVAVLRNGMILLGVNPIVFMIAQGAVIILAVWWSMLPRQERSVGA